MLTLYRRHIKDCPVHHLGRVALDCCQCPIWIYGRTETDLIPRQSTGLTDLRAAEAFRASLTARSQDEAIHGPKLEDCAAKFLAAVAAEVSVATARHYELMLQRLRQYCEVRSIFFMSELTIDLLESFKVEGLVNLEDSTKAVEVSRLKTFLRRAYRREWIRQDLATKLINPRVVHVQTQPYTDAEVQRLLDGTSSLRSGHDGYAKHPQTFRLLLELMLETGMRVGDSIVYEPAKTVKGEILWRYTFVPDKQPRGQHKTLDTWLSDRLKLAIDGCHWLGQDQPFRWGGLPPTRLATEVWKRMATIGDRVGIEDCRPHRLRDTFAVRKLLSGLQIEDVQHLLGHSSVQTTEKYYAAWVPAHQQRLERLLAGTV